MPVVSKCSVDLCIRFNIESLHFRVSPKRSHRSKTAAAMDPDAVVKVFVEHYYTTFDAHLYWDSSMLSFEGHNIQGSQSIVAKLTRLPFRQCQHSITTIDCQPPEAYSSSSPATSKSPEKFRTTLNSARYVCVFVCVHRFFVFVCMCLFMCFVVTISENRDYLKIGVSFMCFILCLWFLGLIGELHYVRSGGRKNYI